MWYPLLAFLARCKKANLNGTVPGTRGSAPPPLQGIIMARPKLSVAPMPDEDSVKREGYQCDSFAQVRQEHMPYLLPGRIVANGLSILEGDPNCGKSTFLAHLVASITTGKPWLGRKKQQPRNVLWLFAEDAASSMVLPRLVAAGADVSRVKKPEPDCDGMIRQLCFPRSMPVLYELVARFDLALVIIEPVVSYVEVDCNLNVEQLARSVMDPLNQMGIRTNCCVIVTRGLKKDRRGPRHTHGSGHGSILSCARSANVIDRPNEFGAGRILRTLKCGGTRDTPALSYNLVGAPGDAPTMGGLVELTSDQDDYAGDQMDIGERGVLVEARTLLRTLLDSEYVPSKEVIQIAKDAGISERSLNKIKAELKVHSKHERQSRPYYVAWGPPLHGWPAAPDAPVAPLPVAPLPKKPRKSRKK